MYRLRLGVAALALAGALAPAAGAREAKKAYAPQAVALVRRYLGALQRGDVRTACRLFSVPSVCGAGADAHVGRFTLSPARPTVDGVEVEALIDSEDALFELVASHGRYRIVDVVVDPALEG
jgi:hypothetical protein